MNRSLEHRLDELSELIGAACPACRHLGPHVITVRRRQGDLELAPPQPPRCASCGREREQMTIQLTRVSRSPQ